MKAESSCGELSRRVIDICRFIERLIFRSTRFPGAATRPPANRSGWECPWSVFAATVRLDGW